MRPWRKEQRMGERQCSREPPIDADQHPARADDAQPAALGARLLEDAARLALLGRRGAWLEPWIIEESVHEVLRREQTSLGVSQHAEEIEPLGAQRPAIELAKAARRGAKFSARERLLPRSAQIQGELGL